MSFLGPVLATCLDLGPWQIFETVVTVLYAYSLISPFMLINSLWAWDAIVIAKTEVEQLEDELEVAKERAVANGKGEDLKDVLKDVNGGWVKRPTEFVALEARHDETYAFNKPRAYFKLMWDQYCFQRRLQDEIMRLQDSICMIPRSY